MQIGDTQTGTTLQACLAVTATIRLWLSEDVGSNRRHFQDHRLLVCPVIDSVPFRATPWRHRHFKTKKLFQKLFLCVVLVLFNETAISADNVWEVGLQVNQVISKADGNIVFSLSHPLTGCMPANKVNIALNQNGMGIDALKANLSVGLAALTTGKNIRVLYDKSASECWVNMVILDRN